MINLQKGREKTQLEFVLFDDISLCPLLWNTVLHVRLCVLSRARVSSVCFWSADHNLEQSAETICNTLKERLCDENSTLPRNSSLETAASEIDQTSAFL